MIGGCIATSVLVSNPSQCGLFSISPRPLPLIGGLPLPHLFLPHTLDDIVLDAQIILLKSKASIMNIIHVAYRIA